MLTQGFNNCGIDVIQIAMATTPVLYAAVFTKPVDGGVMITGSHNPANHNGFKICLGKQTLFGPQIQEIKQIALTGEFAAGTGGVESMVVVDDYVADVVSKITPGPRKIRAIV